MVVCKIGTGEQVVAQLGPTKGLGVVAAAVVAAVSQVLVVSVEIHCTRVIMFRSFVVVAPFVDDAAAGAPTPGLRPMGGKHE